MSQCLTAHRFTLLGPCSYSVRKEGQVESPHFIDKDMMVDIEGSCPMSLSSYMAELGQGPRRLIGFYS